MLRFGPPDRPLVIAALPLFEEANRTRAFVLTICRLLAERGIASAIPDLPGQGESLTPTQDARLASLREAFAAAATTLRPTFTLAIRSGTLLDTHAQVTARYHLAPMTGTDLRRELVRIRQASAKEAGEPFDPASIDIATTPIEIAGNPIAPALLRELADAIPSTTAVRTVRLGSDPKPADAKFPGSPLWRRAEPDNDPALATAIADDIAAWIATCAA